jgi:hypothetical protein
MNGENDLNHADNVKARRKLTALAMNELTSRVEMLS